MSTAIAIPTRTPEIVVTARAWDGMKPELKRAIVARAMGTQQSVAIDAGVQRFDRVLALPKPTGDVGDALWGMAATAFGIVVGFGAAWLLADQRRTRDKATYDDLIAKSFQIGRVYGRNDAPDDSAEVARLRREVEHAKNARESLARRAREAEAELAQLRQQRR